MFHFCNITKALSDENRLRIIMALKHKALCVCQLTALLDLAPSTTSKHLSILRQAQLIDCVKNGRWAFYKLPEQATNKSIAMALTFVIENLSDNPKILEDKARIQEILLADVCAPEQNFPDDHGHSAYLHSLVDKNEDVDVADESNSITSKDNYQK